MTRQRGRESGRLAEGFVDLAGGPLEVCFDLAESLVDLRAPTGRVLDQDVTIGQRMLNLVVLGHRGLSITSPVGQLSRERLFEQGEHGLSQRVVEASLNNVFHSVEHRLVATLH